MIVSRLSTITAALLALTLGASSVRAQTGATPDDTTTPSEQAPARPPSQAARRMMMRVDKHIAQLHRRLRITPAEEPQWHAFAAVMRENAVRMADVSATRAATEAKMNAVEDLRSYAAVATVHAEGMQHLLPVFEQLYRAMSPQQRQITDEVFRAFERRRETRRPPG